MQSAGGSHDALFTSLRRGQPLSLQAHDAPTPAGFGEARCRRIEFTSRGDRVPGRLLLPPRGEGPHPLILLQHGLGGSKDAAHLDVAARWVAEGAAVVSIDLPLHGERYSPKLSERLHEITRASLSATGEDARARPPSTFALEFARQSVSDLGCCLDAVTEMPEIAADRVAYAGFSFGAILGASFCAFDPRPRAAALALAGGGFGPAILDPACHIARIAPRPVLLIGAKQDDVVAPRLTEALFDAAAEPKSLEWFDGEHQSLPGEAMKAMWSFLRDAIGLR